MTFLLQSKFMKKRVKAKSTNILITLTEVKHKVIKMFVDFAFTLFFINFDCNKKVI
jgi:hypothetical protein